MAVVRLAVTAREAYAGGEAFGEAGAYEEVRGLLTFAVSPRAPANVPIVDLDRAPRDADGRVQFVADFCLLQPADPARANRRLLLDVPNRGRKVVPGLFNLAPPTAEPPVAVPPGDGFLFRRGWSVAWCGWQWDVIREPALLGVLAPDARVEEPGQVSVWHQPTVATKSLLLADRVHQPYPVAARTDDPDATLYVRDAPYATAMVIPRDRWQFARETPVGPVPDAAHVFLADGFEAGKVYEVVYHTARCPVVSTGLLAVRDCVAFLRYAEGAENPCAGRLDRAYAFGMSQSGRFLRHFLHLGLNADEMGRRVFDGVWIHVAGARRGEFNHRYAQPSQQHTPSFGHLPPFTSGTGDTDEGLLARQRSVGQVPKVFQTNTAAEYWRGDGSLIHTDTSGERDVEPPPEERIYHLAGTQHGAGVVPLSRINPNDGARGAHGFNALDYRPLMRAALVAFDAWVSDGTEPPPSRFPRLRNGTAVPAASVLPTYAVLPGATVPDAAVLPTIRRLDLGPDAQYGIGRYPATVGTRYPASVAAVDADGNERGGVAMPDLAVPVATYTGWNPRDPATGGAGQIIPMQGSTFPFPATAAARAATGDPRRSIAERYGSRGEYLARVRAAALSLVAARWLLPEDVPLTVALAATRYDAFVGEGT